MSKWKEKLMIISVVCSVLVVIVIFFIDVRFAYAEVSSDSDNDGLSDSLEAVYYTDPNNPDTDGDGYTDGMEVESGYSPLLSGGKRMHESDFDGDGLNDWLERWFGSDMGKSDTDGDGYDDYTEVMFGYDPQDNAPNRRFEKSRQIVVNLDKQRLYYMVDGVKIHNMPVSTGNPWTPTPVGTFVIANKIDKKDYRGTGYFVKDVEWNMMFLPQYYIHGTYWHNDFGIRTHSHGCVNLTNADAKIIYDYAEAGIPIIIEGQTPKNGKVKIDNL